MNTPICDFVQNYIDNKPDRLHMPGHKGTGVLGCEARDITEVAGADVLYASGGIIAESQQNATALFGSAKTLYSTEGSSLSIRAMLYLALLQAKSRGRAPLILAGRNAHKSFVSGVALLDIEVQWLWQEEYILGCNITPKQLQSYLDGQNASPTALYITSPDYLGQSVDIEGLAAVCHSHDMLLLVDNAHGAYLRFLPEDCHPVTRGADICCDSAHKTLPVLTGGGYLHIAKNASGLLAEHAEAAMSMFASTSPSYLILQSLDAANRYLSDGYSQRLAAYTEKIEKLKNRLRHAGYTLAASEPLKITIDAKAYGYTGSALQQILAQSGMVCEFADADWLVMMLSLENGTEVLEKIEAVLCALPPKASITTKPPKLRRPQVACSARQAMLSLRERLPLSKCEGRVLANMAVSCPPAVPILVGGEIVDRSAIQLMHYYGYQSLEVMQKEEKI